MKTWRAASAQLLNVSVTGNCTEASYRSEIGGVSYQNDRVDVAAFSDRLGNYQAEMASGLANSIAATSLYRSGSILGTHGQTHLHVVQVPGPRDHDDRGRGWRHLAEELSQLKAFSIRQIDVEDCDVEKLLFESFQAAVHRYRGHDVMTVAFQAQSDQLKDGGIIIDCEDGTSFGGGIF